MNESLGCQFSRTKSGIKLRRVVQEQSRAVMTFLNTLGVTNMFYTLRLVTQIKNLSANNFAFSDAEDKTSGTCTL